MKEAHLKYLQLDPNARQVDGSHYKAAFQHWDLVPLLNLSWQEGCATKYIERCFKKGKTVLDLEKAIHYTEKLIKLVLTGIVQGKPNSQLVAFGHIKVYEEWIAAQDLRAPTPELEELQRGLLHAWSRWSWSEKSYSVEDQVDSLIAIVNATRTLLVKFGEYQELSDARVAAQSETEATPTEADIDSEALRAYNAQSLDPSNQSATQAEASEPTQVASEHAPVEAVEAQADSVAPDILQQLRNASASAFQMMQMQRTVSIPLVVIRDMLTAYQRENVKPGLDLSPRLPASGNPLVYTSFRDYAEPLLKVQLGLQALDESIPNRQLMRTLIAVAAVQDGLTCMMEWLLRMTEGPFPAVTNLEEQDKIRVSGLVLRKEIAQRSVAALQLQGLTPSEYATGVKPEVAPQAS